MLCPVCKTQALGMSERQGIEIDFCPQCRGVWLDRGELDKIIEQMARIAMLYRRRSRYSIAIRAIWASARVTGRKRRKASCRSCSTSESMVRMQACSPGMARRYARCASPVGPLLRRSARDGIYQGARTSG